MKEQPKVSVIMITYGHEKFIAQAINGVLMQECDFEVELIIANDCSPDKTDEVIQNILKNHSRASWIKYRKHENNLGMMPNFIFALQQCKGEYIALCEGDDYWKDPLKLQKQVDFLEANKEYVVCYHDASVVNDVGDTIMESLLPLKFKIDNNSFEIKKGAWLLPLTICYRNVLKDFPSQFSKVFNGDTFLISMLGNYGKGKWINSIKPAAYRIHSGGVWSSKTAYERNLAQIHTYTCLLQFYNEKKDKDLTNYFGEVRLTSGLKLLEQSINLKNYLLVLKNYFLILFKCEVIYSFSRFFFFHKSLLKLIYSKIKKYKNFQPL